MRRTLFFTVVILLALFLVHPAFGSDLRRSAVVKAVEDAGPAVVNVSTEMVVKRTSPFGNIGGPSLDDFFNDFFETHPNRRSYKRKSLGSGVIIRKDGYILTNEHVIQRASKITVTLLDGREFDAVVVGADSSSDLAILKIKAKSLPVIKVGDSDSLMIGETVIAIGNPFGLSHTVTTGVVSAQHRSFRAGDNRVFTDFIQTDASINPGNSGGPLLNIDGELVGINSAIYGQAQGIGFAIPIARAQRIVENLINYGKVRHGWLGIRVGHMTYQDVRIAKTRKGVLVETVFEQSPAQKAGIRQGDILTKVGGIPVDGVEGYKSAVLSVTVNSTVDITAVRNGKPLSFQLTATVLPAAAAERFAWQLMGIQVVPNSEKVAKSYGLQTTQGMVIKKVKVNSPAGKIGIQPGDILLAIGDRMMNSKEEFQKASASLRLAQSAIIVVQRGQRAYYLSLGL